MKKHLFTVLSIGVISSILIFIGCYFSQILPVAFLVPFLLGHIFIGLLVLFEVGTITRKQ